MGMKLVFHDKTGKKFRCNRCQGTTWLSPDTKEADYPTCYTCGPDGTKDESTCNEPKANLYPLRCDACGPFVMIRPPEEDSALMRFCPKCGDRSAYWDDGAIEACGGAAPEPFDWLKLPSEPVEEER